MSRRRKRRFRVYPDNGVVYYEVRFYRSKAKLNKALGDNGHTLGNCRCWDKLSISKDGTTTKLLPSIGQISLTDSFSSSILAHECCHAAHYYFNWRKDHGFKLKFGPDGSEESRDECFARVVGTLVRQILNNYFREEKIGYQVFPLNKVVLK